MKWPIIDSNLRGDEFQEVAENVPLLPHDSRLPLTHIYSIKKITHMIELLIHQTVHPLIMRFIGN